MILKKEKLKKERRKEEEARTYESKKGRRRRIVKKSNGKNWFGEYKYIGKDYSRSIIILSLKGLDKRTTLDWVITRELDKVPVIGLSTLYTLDYWSML